jgi:hypothetical protein
MYKNYALTDEGREMFITDAIAAGEDRESAARAWSHETREERVAVGYLERLKAAGDCHAAIARTAARIGLESYRESRTDYALDTALDAYLNGYEITARIET